MVWAATALLLALAQSPDSSAEGMKALDAQNYELAAQHFTRAVEADPKDYTAHFNLALAWTMAGQDDRAIAGYRKVLELKPGLYEAQLNLGTVLLRHKQPKEALPYLDAAAAAKPNEFRPHLLLAHALYDTGDYGKGAESYQAALALDPKSAAAENGLARCELETGRLKEAEAHFRAAAELDPSLKDAALELGPRYEKNGQTGEAIALYSRYSDNPGARERLGQLLVEAGRAAEAIPHLEWAVGKSPTAANRLALAQAYRQNKQPEKVLPVLGQAVAADPDDLDLRMAYGRELRDRLKYAAAAEQFGRVAAKRPEFLPAWNELTAMLVSLEDTSRALAALDRIRALGGETPGHLYLRAIVLDRMKDRKNALEYYRRFLAADQGKLPEEEFKARHRAIALERELGRR